MPPTKTKPNPANVLAKLQKLETQARGMIAESSCPKCGGEVLLYDTADSSHDTPWRPNRGSKVSNDHTYYCGCRHFCWIGPTSGDPVQAAQEWLNVTSAGKEIGS